MKRVNKTILQGIKRKKPRTFYEGWRRWTRKIIERGFDDERAEKAPRQVNREADEDSLRNTLDSGHGDGAEQATKELSAGCARWHPG